jgi:fatty-acyl-CoA synthase
MGLSDLGVDGKFDAVARRQTLFDIIAKTAARTGGKMAISCGETAWTYRQFVDIVEDIAGGLTAHGIEPGNRVAVLSRNSHWYMALRFAVVRAGGIFVPINFMLVEDEVAYILENAGVTALFVDESCAQTGIAAAKRVGVAKLFGLPDPLDRADIAGVDSLASLQQTGCEPIALEMLDGRQIAQIIYTSGTESRPKGAMLSHEAIIWQFQTCIVDCDWRSGVRALHALPLFHCAQLDAFLGPSLHVGGSNWIIASPDPTVVLPMIEKHRLTSFFAPPTVWIALLRSPLFDQHDLSSLTHGYYGASIMPVEIIRQISERLPNIRLWNCYGQTEIAPVAVVLQPEDQVRKAGSAGRAGLHVETRLVDDDMNDVLTGQVGEIVHRSPQLLTGYWNDPVRTAEAFSGGWFHSGDLGIMDDEGYITVVDRKKDMIKSGGENVASREVEEVIYGHPAVSEVAVVGLPHPEWIEMVSAFVVPRAGETINDAELIGWCRERLAGFKSPKKVFVVDELPKNASGKIMKRELRAQVTAETG